MTDWIPNSLSFLWCLYLQSIPLYQNFNPGFGVLWNISEISSQFNLGQFHPSKLRENTWRQKQSCGQNVAPGHCSHAAVDGGGGASEVVPMQCTQSEKPLYDITLGSPPLDVWEGWGRSSLGCCYGSLGNKAGRTWRKVPLSYREDISVKLCLRYLDLFRTFTWKFSAQQSQGSPLFITNLSFSDSGSGMCTQDSWTLWHGSHCADQAAWSHCGT
jgi:hypothetical protein